MFVSAVNKYTTGGCHYQTRTNTNANSNGAIFLHVTYHNCGPSSKRLQSQLHCLISNPPYDTPLSSITNSHGRTINPRLLVLFHQIKNLGDLLSSRKSAAHVCKPMFLLNNVQLLYFYFTCHFIQIENTMIPKTQ